LGLGDLWGEQIRSCLQIGRFRMSGRVCAPDARAASLYAFVAPVILGLVQTAASSRVRRPSPRLCLLALVAGLLVTPLPASAERPHGSVLAWGCDFIDFGQCSVPAAAGSGVAAIAAGDFHSAALTKAGGVIAWGCGSGRDVGQCNVPA